jgi:Domain of unknown function DUF29
MTNTLYDRDLQLWIEQTVRQLQNREFAALDVEHLIEELVDLGRAEKNALKSNLTILLAHLLKLRVQHDVPEMMKGSWYSSVLEDRQRVLDNLADTPSLQSLLTEMVEKAYQSGRRLAVKEGSLAKFGVKVPAESDYPLVCPFEIAQILDEDFYGI